MATLDDLLNEPRRVSAEFSAEEKAEIERQTTAACVRAKLTEHLVDIRSFEYWKRTFKRALGYDFFEADGEAGAEAIKKQKRDMDRARRKRSATDREAKKAAVDAFMSLPPHPASRRGQA